MNRYLAFLASTILSVPALAQTPGQWTVGDQGANWSVSSTKPTGSAPADAYEPAQTPLPTGETVARWTFSIGDGLTTSRCAPSPGGFYVNKNRGTTCSSNGTSIVELGEKKIRVTCGPSTAKRKDNLLGYGVRYFGHGHQGYGSISWDENTSYATIRADPRSSCQGVILNASNYMEPAVKAPTSSGAKLSVLAQNQSVYYIEGDQDEPNESTWIRRGMGWLWGSPPNDFNDTKRRAEYAAAGLVYPGASNTPAGMLGWNCTNGDGVRVYPKAEYGITNGAPSARFFRGPGGVDAFEGRCTGTANGPAHLQSDLISPNCWDRTNLLAADARGHTRYMASAINGSRTGVCPKTSSGVDWGRIPQGQAKNDYVTTGFADYGTWTLTSDNMRMSTTECPDATAPCDGVSGGNVPATINGVYYSRVSLSPCRSTGLDFWGGETLHADYTFGWHSDTFEVMERECLGLTVRGVAPTDGPAECNNGVMSRYLALTNNPPTGASYWTGGCDATFDCRDSVPSKPKERYAVIEGDNAGNVTLHH